MTETPLPLSQQGVGPGPNGSEPAVCEPAGKRSAGQGSEQVRAPSTARWSTWTLAEYRRFSEAPPSRGPGVRSSSERPHSLDPEGVRWDR